MRQYGRTKAVLILFAVLLSAFLCPVAALADPGLSTQNVGDTEPEPDPAPVCDLGSNGSLVLDYTKCSYTGKERKPKANVTYSDPETGSVAVLEEGRDLDFTVEYKNNVKAGTATVVVTGTGTAELGGYVGSLSATFTITPSAAKPQVGTANTAYMIKGGKLSTHSSTNSAGCGMPASRLTDRQAIVSNAYMSGIKIANRCKNISGSIAYRVNQRGRGWTAWRTGSIAGSSKKGYPIQAIEVKLTGSLAKSYDVYYRVNIFGCDWMGWAKNGQMAGVSSSGPLCVRKFQVKLRAKGLGVPSECAIPRYSTSSTKDAYYKAVLLSKIDQKASGTKYAISVNTEFNRVGVFKGSAGNWTMVQYWKCSTGASTERYATSHATFTTTGKRGLSFGESEGHSCWYWTQIYSSVRFHSVLFVPGSKSALIDGTLGERRSNGCIRLPIDAAKWIYSNVKKGTVVVIS